MQVIDASLMLLRRVELRLKLHNANVRVAKVYRENRFASAMQCVFPELSRNGGIVVFVHHFLNHKKEKLLLGWNVGVDAHGSHAKIIGQGTHGKLSVAALVNHAKCRIDHLPLRKRSFHAGL